jgi:hypothetical protein
MSVLILLQSKSFVPHKVFSFLLLLLLLLLLEGSVGKGEVEEEKVEEEKVEEDRKFLIWVLLSKIFVFLSIVQDCPYFRIWRKINIVSSSS